MVVYKVMKLENPYNKYGFDLMTKTMKTYKFKQID